MLNPVTLPITPDYDPRRVEEGEMERAVEKAKIAVVNDELDPMEKLLRLAGSRGDLSEALDEATLAKIGIRCVEEYERDKSDRKEWEDVATEALNAAAQEAKGEAKAYPWPNASNIRYPVLATAMLQFNARAYPAVVKGDEAVLCKVIGRDQGRPVMGPDGQPLMRPVGPPAAEGQPPQLEPVWLIPPGAKASRAQRVSEYLNTTIFYRMSDWESDTDALLMQLPVVGCVFRKCWVDQNGKPCSATVSALRVIVPQGARSVETTPRLTEELPDQFGHDIRAKMRSGHYRNIDLGIDPENDKGRLLLEQQRWEDLDEDGVDEPYIVTIDKETMQVLRIEANFSPDSLEVANDNLVSIKRGKYYVKYPFFPDPRGNFYDLGLGHLLRQLGDVIDTAINQLMDAGHAQTAGGGFIASGVRLQARGGGSTVRFQPGVYKTVDVAGSVLRDAIVEKTLPNVSPVTFQILDLVLGAARDLSGVKDVITGEASNNGQVGTTLALIEQGLQVFNAIYKRVYRALSEEFALLFENIGRYGGQAAAEDYSEVMDDPAADFAGDFNQKGLDIRPVSDPSSVTRMQKMAKSQFLFGTIETVVQLGGNGLEIMRRVFEAADIEDIDKILPKEPPAPQPNPKDVADAELKQAQTADTAADVQRKNFELERDAVAQGMALGVAA